MNENAMLIRAQRAASPETQARKLAGSIYPGVLKPFARSFYNRDNLWERGLQASILSDQPIQMVGFWGIGGKQEPDRYDEGLLAEYEAIREAIGKQYPQAADMMLILANAHGRFNGYQDFDGYLGNVAANANQRGIASISLDELYRDWRISLPNPSIPVDKKSNEWKKFEKSRRFDQLVESAEKHSQVGIAPEDAAFHYWMMRRQEREPLAQSFSNAILLVNGSEDLGREVLPLNMPHMYMKVGPVWFQHD
ncbi:MAG: hypothetical protein US40_C0019G0011 [Candidatus Roizmanbacteria bacterium GW2011_GWC2_37_13]|uniref:Uncharacterized protein n=1 Tax=Candidatus Roizmanbacteria bacterium GW2011_GWC2_37_13 TaxID=1618486 RepID=A0A0G0GDH6_9BACT|nr:MAG: hypothetical protein US40_C0019G0011 [Candidatus Roizmanbacteria bacterium GW2011_GWC2_37_13]